MKQLLNNNSINRTKNFCKIVKVYTEFEYLRVIKKQTNTELGRWTKEKLVELGPTFIKIGQFMSSRTDIFGEEITSQLKDLQDNVSPLNYTELKDLVKPLENKLSYINEVPIASASIAQVHIGKLQDGQDIVLKIKRPNINDKIVDDFEALLFGINILKQLSNDRKINEFNILFNEYYNLLKEEIDFFKEVDNMKKFKENFKNKKWVKIPSVFEDLCTNDIIVMEYIQSSKIDNLDNLNKLNFNKELIAQKLIEMLIKQIIDYGFVHIDPHPGNVGITQTGQIVFYDFGMMLSIDKHVREKFSIFLMAIYDKDVNLISQIAIDMGLVVIEPENIPYFKTFLISFLNYIETANIEDFKNSYLKKLYKTSTPFLLSSKFVLLSRGISILEGLCIKLDPNFNFKSTLDTYIDKYLFNIGYLEGRAMNDIKLFSKLPNNSQNNQIQIEVIEKTLKDVEQNLKDEQNEKNMMFLALLSIFIMHNEFDLGLLTFLSFIGIYVFKNKL